ncbi:MAG TPA: ATP-binding cassette domain-containing protein [Solirubrobacterales bacterium]|jgi:energy-coupling factor transport system ATP-binding protein|nr:ATP-binding cassette domain-containing protein [Solirubrobacterales bacterium]
MIDAALQLDRFSFTYPGRDRPSLNDLTLTIGRGDFVLVCGDSGSGKSTLLRTASGLVPHHFGGSVEGEAAICGMDLRTHRAGALAAVCGTVFQDPEVQIVMGSVRHEIAFPLENAGWPPGEIAVAVEETALVLGIHQLLDRRTSELSGGELQRVVLAAAIAARPQLLVLDEPTSQLDPIASEEMIAALAKLNAEWGTTVLLADHRIERCLEHADRVIVMHEAEVACDAPAPEFLDWASNGREHLLTPLARLFNLAGVRPLPVGSKQARRVLGPDVLVAPSLPVKPTGAPRVVLPKRSGVPEPIVLSTKKLSYSYGAAPPAIDRLSLEIRAGERIALMGANGSGKSTLLRLLRQLEKPATGEVSATGPVGLLLQNPNDYLIHERVSDEAPPEQLKRFGLESRAANDPRDLSGGERQRLALAIVLQDEPVALLLDEPTRGMDRRRKQELASIVNGLANAGTAVVVATHDTEFAAAFADRVVLLGGGRVLADDHSATVLGGGWHYATDTAKLLPQSGATTPERGALLLVERLSTLRPTDKPLRVARGGR